MNISEILSPKFTEFDIGTPLSKVAGAFENQELDAVVVTDGDEYRGVVSRRQLASSSNQPSAKVGSRVQHVPTVNRTADVREVARLMIGSGAKTLPVLDDDRVVGIVTGDSILEAVQSFLSAVTVADAYTEKLISAAPTRRSVKPLNTLREGRIAHLPVVDDGEAVGMVSLYDIVDFTTRGGTKSQGGSPGNFGGRHGGERHGGLGAREGDSDRMLDLPVRNLMSDVVVTVRRSAPLDDGRRNDVRARDPSLVVLGDQSSEPIGVVTKTDVLEALTWEQEDRNAVQVFGLDLLDGMDYLSPRRESRRLRRSESDNPKRFANDAMDGYSTLFRTIKSICLHRLYMAIQVTRTYIGSIQNQRQVQSGLDSLGDSASKIWNVARWTADRIWDETGKIPDVSVLKAYMKNQACWKDLNAQSSQKVIEELSDAFQSWFDLRQKDDTANPPGYRKHGDERPRSTVTFKDGFKHDPTTTASDSRKVPISRGIGRISCCANTRPALTLISQKSTRYRTFVRSGTVTSGNYTSSVKSSSKPTTPQEMK